MNRLFLPLCFLCAWCVFNGCQPKGEAADTTSLDVATDMASEYADFVAFYQRFHQDSLYQMEHIVFPLDGLPAEADSTVMAGGTFKWQRDSWRMHKGFDLESSGFEQELQPLGKDLITETFFHEKTGFGLMRRFARIDGEWNLIYYAGMNRLK
jgi:hypothetical protein